MGLDAVELVMAVEEAFGIQIKDDDYADIRTVGHLHDLVIERSPVNMTGSTCLSPRAFCRLRRAIIDVLGVAKSDIRLDTSMDALIPVVDRRTAWSRLNDALTLGALPTLTRPAWMVQMLVGGTVMMAATCALCFHLALGLPVEVTGVLTAAIVVFLGFTLIAVSQPYADRIPWSCTTVRDATSTLMAGNYRQLVAEGHSMGRSESFEVLRSIISRQLDIPVEKITRDASFVDDLGVD